MLTQSRKSLRRVDKNRLILLRYRWQVNRPSKDSVVDIPLSKLSSE
jgi:hypothetical protein